jgi:NAD(P)-dependent dehydrogenase (short-subunit alcohol dehydrogenase family)
MTARPAVILFGASGAIGAACADAFLRSRWEVQPMTRSAPRGVGWVSTSTENWESALQRHLGYAAAVWAQGANASGGVDEMAEEDVARLVDANAGYVVRTLRTLLRADLLLDPSRIVLIGSVWGVDRARRSKAAYVMSKAAVSGLTTSLAVDLASRGILVNQVDPGVLDTPMTHEHLTVDQVATVTAETPTGRLATVHDVAELVVWLAGAANQSITGQRIAVDGGWSVMRRV